MTRPRVPWAFLVAAACWLVPLATVGWFVGSRDGPTLDSPRTGRGVASARCALVAEAHLPDRRAMRVAFGHCMEGKT